MYHTRLTLCLLGLFAAFRASTQQPSCTRPTKAPRPNIFLIFADDMGFDDISFHGSDQIPTPNIDALHTYGIALQRFYTAPMCTPTRSATLTGRYPSTVGMQRFVIPNYEPWGLGLDEKVMPEYMKEAGYETHLVGKWHAGFYEKSYAPNARGYDSFFGCLGGYIDYYNHSADAFFAGLDNGYDIRDNLDVSLATLGRYSTDLFTDVALQKIAAHNSSNPLFMHLSYTAPHAANNGDPMQAPEELVREFGHIRNEKRRRYAAMVTSLDRNIGRFVEGIDRAGLLENSVIVFMQDNGSPIRGLFDNAGSNHPFRGQKNSPWDGAAHVAAAIWSPLLRNKMERISHGLMHTTDWLPTFAGLAGVAIDRPIDGVDQWESLSQNKPSPRNDVLINVDQVQPYVSYISGRFKYVNGTTADGIYDGWLSEYNDRTERPVGYRYAEALLGSKTAACLGRFSKLRSAKILGLRQSAAITCNNVPVPKDPARQCRPLESACLFNIEQDPCERDNLAAREPWILSRIRRQAEDYVHRAATPRNRPFDMRCNPTNFNQTWTYWFDLVGPRNS